MKVNKPQLYLYIAGACLLLVIGLTYYHLFSSFSAKPTTEYVYIDEDDTQDSVFAKLSPIASTHAMNGFRTLARHSGYGDNIRTGRYAIHPGEGVFTVFRHLKNGLQTPMSITIPEVRTMDRLAGALSKKLMLDSTAIAAVLTNNEACKAYGYDTATITALFIPNTYDIYWNITLENFIKRMQKEHDAFWNAERKGKAKNMNMSPTEVATMASIIDEETANNAEKPMIAGMYYNRWKLRNGEYPNGMPLQADPTIKFAWKKFELRRIYYNLLQINSPYNTYKNAGLPPGPIKIASIAGIDAVLNHVPHNYLYMCAKEDFSGTHNFAETYAEHLQNAVKYSKALNKRGIK